MGKIIFSDIITSIGYWTGQLLSEEYLCTVDVFYGHHVAVLALCNFDVSLIFEPIFMNSDAQQAPHFEMNY